MAIPVTLFQYDGLAYDSGDISFGETENKEISINTGTTIIKVSLPKFTVTFKARGCKGSDLATLEAKREASINGLLSGNTGGETINIFGKVITNAHLTKVTPTAPITVNGHTLFESIDTEYVSQDYS
jgi:hypothetical protein